MLLLVSPFPSHVPRYEANLSVIESFTNKKGRRWIEKRKEDLAMAGTIKDNCDKAGLTVNVIDEQLERGYN
jgi:hypothetical protein